MADNGTRAHTHNRIAMAGRIAEALIAARPGVQPGVLAATIRLARPGEREEMRQILGENAPSEDTWAAVAMLLDLLQALDNTRAGLSDLGGTVNP
jgi:hypothetical protein